MLVPGQAKLTAAAAAVAAPKAGAWKKLRGRGRRDWSDDSDSEEEEEASQAAPASLADRLDAAMRPDMTWAAQHKFGSFVNWCASPRAAVHGLVHCPPLPNTGFTTKSLTGQTMPLNARGGWQMQQHCKRR